MGMNWARRAVFAAMLCVVSACAAGDSAGNEQAEAEPAATIFLVRHAEKVLDVPNPPLTDAGKARAVELVDVLSASSLERVHSTDYLRTRQTAAPFADFLGVEIEIYDPSDLSSFTEMLRSAGGKHLVVGHSNTTPQLVEAFGGDPGTPIDEAAEYDRLYILKIDSGGDVTTKLRRYGKLYQPAR